MQEVFDRLTGSPPLLTDGNVKRSHRTAVTKAKAPEVHLVDGADSPKDPSSDCRTARTKEFTVSVFGRGDAGVSALDSIVIDINRRLDPTDNPYTGATLKQRAIVPEEEIADNDALRVDMGFVFEYETAGWSLETAA